ncbi:SanA protein [Mesonia phycicola]|uniref:SanA protein n=1 Tax=Mesonia phycicola TaxID=579105 RepID=A0A1M6BLV6_9FLAO|nr:SanA protein [Mesonia phycicola]
MITLLKKRKVQYLLIIIILSPILFIGASNYFIEKNSINKTYFNTSQIPQNKVGLVLGTSKKLQNGNINLYFKYRIEATVALYKEEKIEFILVSGDNSSKNYDEPSDFKEELIKFGIPEDKIFLDYAGFRTLDSVIRAKEIFGQNNITIISQQFHNERAIYIAEHNGINAVGFNAKNVSYAYGIRVQLREYLARSKVFLDILFHVKPKFLGDKVKIS